MTLRLCGKQNAYLTGLLQKSRRPQSAQKSRTLLRLSLCESSSRGALRLLRSSRYALTRPDRFAAGASRSSGNLTASARGECRNPQSLPRLRHDPADNEGVDVAVGEEGGHGSFTIAQGFYLPFEFFGNRLNVTKIAQNVFIHPLSQI